MFSESQFAPSDLLRVALERLAQERFAQSVAAIEELAASGDAAALYQMAILFQAAREPDTARRYLERSARAGCAEGQFALALLVFSAEDELTPERQQQGLSLLKLATRQHHAQAVRALEGLSKSIPPVSSQSAEPRGGGVPAGSANSRLAPASSASLHDEPGSNAPPLSAWQLDGFGAYLFSSSGWRASIKSQACMKWDDAEVDHDTGLFPQSRLT